MKKLCFLFVLLAGNSPGQDQPVIQDPTQLIGKQVNVQRLPLCQPGTYTVDVAHAGKQATVVSAKPNKMMPTLSSATLSKMPPDARAMIEEQQKAATLVLQFEDGTKLDTCAPIGPKKLSDYLELAPGQTLGPPSKETAAAAPTPPAANAPPVAQTGPVAHTDLLSGEEVKQALTGKGRDHFVRIEDMGLMAAQGNQVPTITLFMPEAVLAIRSESAKRQFTQYDPPEEDKQRALMIVAQGYAGKTIAEGCTSITRVVILSNPSGGVVEEAYQSEPLPETWRNNFGATNQCQALRTKFFLDDVRKVKAAAPNGEFFVAVFSGTVSTKIYKIKRKHQSKLGLD